MNPKWLNLKELASAAKGAYNDKDGRLILVDMFLAIQIANKISEASKAKSEDSSKEERILEVKDADGTHKCFAKFCAFATDSEELRDGVGNYPGVVVEYDDGNLEWWPLNRVRFVK